jgi:hypothetical protein
VSWQDFRGTGPGIYAGRVSPTGATLDPNGIPVAINGEFKDPPQSAFGGGNYILIWTEFLPDQGTFNNLLAARVSRTGTVLDPTPIGVTTGGGNQLQNGGAYGVMYLNPSFMIVYSNFALIMRARVNPATGAVLDSNVALTSVCCSFMPRIALDGSNALVMYETKVGNDFQLRGTRITPTGTDLDATDFTVASGTGISFDGPLLAGSGEGAMLTFDRYDPTTGITAQRVKAQQVSSVPVFPLIEGRSPR